MRYLPGVVLSCLALSAAVAPASMADPGNGNGGPPGILCSNPGGFGDGFSFTPGGPDHNLQICHDLGGHSAGRADKP